MRRALLGLLIAAAAFEASTAPWAFAQSSSSAVLTRLIWFDRSGQRLGAVGPIADHGNLEISPDGTRVAVAVTDAARATRDIWMYHLSSGERTQFTSDPADENWLIWSPDGGRVLLNSFARDHLTLLEASATGAAERKQLLEGNEGKWPVSEMAAALAAKDRSRCGALAPSHGLYLVRVDYPPGPFPPRERDEPASL